MVRQDQDKLGPAAEDFIQGGAPVGKLLARKGAKNNFKKIIYVGHQESS